MTNRVKIAVTGAAGHIGYALLFRIASGQVFGQDTIVDLNLLEIEPALPALEGVVMELQDCAFSTLGGVITTSDPNVAFDGVHYATLVGSIPRKKGMERGDLLEINGGIFTGQGKAINDRADDDVKVLVVGNPCNTNCLIAMHSAPDVPKDRFFAMTMLDQNRATTQLALKSNQPVTAVSDMIIWGNHSATQFPDFYNAKINGEAATSVINDEAWFESNFIPDVQKRGAAIIEARGASSAASAANGIIDSWVNLINDTPVGESYSMCVASRGQYDVDEGLIFSFPCRTENDEVIVVNGVEHNDDAQAKLQATLDELRHERDTVKALGLI
ncbi:MAG: malate dehydrogenase [Coxiellaceae bacterium]|nr:malate dehydrogenase [Coxiellaceae bacterium]